MLPEIEKYENVIDVAGMIEKNGYIRMSETETRFSFNREYTEKGFAERVFLLHLRNFRDNDELYFRNYLNEHFEIAKSYEELILNLRKVLDRIKLII